VVAATGVVDAVGVAGAATGFGSSGFRNLFRHNRGEQLQYYYLGKAVAETDNERGKKAIAEFKRELTPTV